MKRSIENLNPNKPQKVTSSNSLNVRRKIIILFILSLSMVLKVIKEIECGVLMNTIRITLEKQSKRKLMKILNKSNGLKISSRLSSKPCQI